MNHKLNNSQQNWALLKVFTKEHNICETKGDLSIRLSFALDVQNTYLNLLEFLLHVKQLGILEVEDYKSL